VVLSAVGGILAVTAPADASGGSVFIFNAVPDTGVWSYEATLSAATSGVGSFFASPLALSGNGYELVIGAPSFNSDVGGVAVYFRIAPGDWQPHASSPLIGVDAGGKFGAAVTINDSGQRLIVGVPSTNAGRGMIYVYQWDEPSGFTGVPNTISDPAGQLGAAQFGSAMILSVDGWTLAVGAPADDGGKGAWWSGTWHKHTRGRE
jgi:hypothetical protein